MGKRTAASLSAKPCGANKPNKTPKHDDAALLNAIADLSGVLPKDVKVFLDAIRDIAIQKLREESVFKLHDIILIRKNVIPERAERTRKMFGKEVVIPAKPAAQRIVVQAVRPLYDRVKDVS